jgi:hypothetical protein
MYVVENLILGEKLWEGKGKTMGMAVKSVSANGANQEFTWTATVKGSDCAEGVDGNIMITAMGMKEAIGLGIAKGQGMMTTNSGEVAFIKSYDISKMEDGKSKAIGIWSFMTAAEKLSWMNDLIAIVCITSADPMWMEFDVEIYETK